MKSTTNYGRLSDDDWEEILESIENAELRLLQLIWNLETALVATRKDLQDLQLEIHRLKAPMLLRKVDST